MKNRHSIFRSLLFAALLMLASIAQAKVITGTVTDQTGETIISASVVVKGTTIGTVTDFDGNYTLEVPDDATILVFSYIGLQTQEVAIKSNVINVTLKENSEVLEEVVVTGYGTTKKRDLVTSVASVSADQLKDVPVVSAAEALQGKLAGVSVTTSEGSPDAEVKIRVRGGTSLTQSSEPLYIVDGFPVSSISDIAPGDIASMDVLKDAAATAIYGAQGANGVIIITTKDIKTGDESFKWNVDYTGYMGWRTLAKKYDMMNGEDYLRMQYEFAYLDGKGSDDKMLSNFYKFYDPAYNAENKTHGTLSSVLEYWAGIGDDDWQEATFGGNHLNSNHNISISGGIKKANFNLNYNRIDDNSIMYGSNYIRNNASLKMKFQPIKNLNISATVRFSNTDVLGSGTNPAEDTGSKGESRLRNATSFVPLHGIEDKLKDLEDDTDLGNLYNPLIAIDDNYKHKVDNKLTVSGYISYKFLKHFTVKAEAGYEMRDVNREQYFGRTAYFTRAGDGLSVAQSLVSNPQDYVNALTYNYHTSRFKETNTFEYAQKFNDNAHDFSILIGEEQVIKKGNSLTSTHYCLDKSFTGNTIFASLDQALRRDDIVYIDPNDNMLSFFARANYNYRGRYYLTATFRADASTKFARGNQWGFFPSVAAAWRMIDEAWMEPAQEVMSNLKFRLSYGTVGNNNVELGYLHYDYLESNGLYMQGMDHLLSDGGSSLIAANQQLKWETTITRDFGIDYGFFNERLSGAFDLYWNNTNDLILKYKLATGGYNYQYRNIGSTDNKGVEFSIKGVILDHRSKNLNYGLTVDFNITHNVNKVVSLGGMEDYPVSSACFSTYYTQGYEYLLTVGAPIGDIYGYKTDGWYTTADFAQYNKTKNVWMDADGNITNTPLGDAYPGMQKIVPTGKDEKGKNVYELEKIGNTMPEVTGGFNLSFFIGSDRWGKIDLGANFNYSVGNDVVNMTALDYSAICSSTRNRNMLASFGYGQRYSLFDAEGTFLPTAGSSAKIIKGDDYTAMALRLEEANQGAVTYNPIVSSPVLTDNYVEDASFLRLSSLNIGYSLSQKWIKKAHISNCRIFFSASNLFVVTKYSGLDPEVDTRSKINPLVVGVDFAAFPKSRGFNFGVNLSFE